MNIFKAQFSRLQQQFSGLNYSQKMLACTLVGIMAMSLVWWTRFAGEPEMQPLLNQSFSDSDIAQITQHLDEKGVKYEVSTDRILVPADRKIETLADLGFAHLLPQRTDTGFDDIIKQLTPWDSVDKTQQMWNIAKQHALEQVIDAFPNTQRATVLVDPNEQRRLDGGDVTPTATISIITTSNHSGHFSPKELAAAAVDVVSGAYSDLAGHVSVVIDGRSVSLPDKNSDDGMSDTEADDLSRLQTMYCGLIRDGLGSIPGLVVAVKVDLDTKRTTIDDKQVDVKGTAHLSTSETEHTTETVGAVPSPEPGVSPNTGDNANQPMSVGGAGGSAGSGATSNENSTQTMYENIPSEKVTHTVQGPGTDTVHSASVHVPRSYFVSTYKATHHGKDPEDAVLDQFVSDMIEKMRQEVINVTAIADKSLVSVDWYADDVINGPAPEAAVVASPVTVAIGLHGKEIGVGTLAAISLFMMMMVARKSGPVPPPLPNIPPPMPEPTAANSPTRFFGEGIPLGEVGEAAELFDAMEMDEDQLKTQRMVAQVSSMVSSNPDGAAQMVKRWIDRG